MKKLMFVLVIIALISNILLGIPVSSLDEKTISVIKELDPNLEEVEVVTSQYVEDNNGTIYEETGDYVVVIVNGKIVVLKK